MRIPNPPVKSMQLSARIVRNTPKEFLMPRPDPQTNPTKSDDPVFERTKPPPFDQTSGEYDPFYVAGFTPAAEKDD